MEQRTCQKCGKSFSFKAAPSQLATGRGKYCSRSCGISANHTGLPKPKSRENVLIAIAASRGRAPWNKVAPIVKQCETCGVSFPVIPSLKDKARFCSWPCANAWKRTIRGTGHPLFIRAQMACEMCGKLVWVKQAKLQEFRFCSKRCHGAFVCGQWPHTSGIERALQAELSNRQIAFETEYHVGPFLIDVAFPDRRLAVEADGTYWHGNSKQQAKDRQKDGYLSKNGWRILRLPENEINASVSACVDQIAALLASQ